MTGMPITWNRGDYSTKGLAGGVHLFSITWKTRREEKNWHMRSELPGLTSRRWSSDDADELKAQAEAELAEFVSSLGASFPAGPARQHKLPLIGRDLMLVKKLAAQLAGQGTRGHSFTPLSDYGMAGRGFSFEVTIREDREDTGRVAKVTVVLDRVEEASQ